MAFDTQTVTIKGAELLAAATAANQLIIDGCDATTGGKCAATKKIGKQFTKILNRGGLNNG